MPVNVPLNAMKIVLDSVETLQDAAELLTLHPVVLMLNSVGRLNCTFDVDDVRLIVALMMDV